jgi:hypothetical protein
MSFESLKINELRAVAENFGVDLESAKSKVAIIGILEEEGVTYDLYERFAQVEKEDPLDMIEADYVAGDALKVLDADGQNTVLVKMDRQNGLYQTAGFTFTRDHPFVAMTENQAQFIFDTESGFRLATPKEIQEYYS